MIRGAIFIDQIMMVDFFFIPTDASAMEAVEQFPMEIKERIRQGNKDMAELLDATFTDKPFRGPNNAIVFKGKFVPKQVDRFFELLSRPPPK
jgi:hypothetical protein